MKKEIKQMLKIALLFFVASSAFVLLGCEKKERTAPLSQLPQNETSVIPVMPTPPAIKQPLTGSLLEEANQLWNKVKESAEHVVNVKGNVKVHLQSPSMNQGAGGTIAAKRGEAFYLSLSVFFGMRVLDVLFDKDSIAVHNILQGQYFKGRSTEENVSKMVKVSVPFHSFVDAALGIPTLDSVVYRTVYPAQNGFSFLVEQKGKKIDIEIDKTLENVVRIIQEDTLTSKTTEVLFSDFEQHSGHNGKLVNLPKQIELVTKNGEKTSSLKVNFQSRHINSDDFHITFRPPNIKPILLDDVIFHD